MFIPGLALKDTVSFDIDSAKAEIDGRIDDVLQNHCKIFSTNTMK